MNYNSKITKTRSSAEMKTFLMTTLSLLFVLVSAVAGLHIAKGHPCEGVVCYHNGTCMPWGYRNSFKCFCQVGFVGKYCQIEDPCACKPCKNDGICVIRGDDFRCFCTKDYMGKTCNKVSPCKNVVCQNDGVCEPWGYKDSFKCRCPHGHIGKYCQLQNPCPLKPCKNGGKCVIRGDDFRCFCTKDYMGKTCNKVSPCLNAFCPPGQHCAPWGKYSYKCFANTK